MNWDAIGATAEAVGALAVIITLIYLTYQLCQNTKAKSLGPEFTEFVNTVLEGVETGQRHKSEDA
jgi:hypothetical protein